VTEFFDNAKPDENGRIPVSRIQKIIAARMLESKRTIPTFYLRAQADITDLTRMRRELGRSHKAKIGTNDFIIKAMATGVEQFPLMAGQFAGDYIQIAETVNVGLAVAAPQGLVVPVIKNAHRKSLAEIAHDSKTLTDKARSNKLTLTDLTGATITLSNLGVYNIESFLAVAPPGECSILAVGRAVETSVPRDGNFYERKLMSLTIAADHKVVAGAYAAGFLNYIAELLQQPERLI
jgi:pyruvate dehydrogenase E2 component (dihydrolipoamide acetyltransferase)